VDEITQFLNELSSRQSYNFRPKIACDSTNTVLLWCEGFPLFDHPHREDTMAVIRSFIAIDLPKHIQDPLDQVIQEFQAQNPHSAVRWVPARNIHLTLKFLGEVSSNNLELLTKILQAEIPRHRCFEIKVGTLGAFPSIHRPRVIWIGVEAPGDLMSLQRSIEAETTRLGYAPEERPFSAHLTLGRVSHNASPDEVRVIGEMLKGCTVGQLGATTVERVRLFRSDLEPGGAIYTPLYTFPLAH